jgi:ribonuclease T2
LSQRDYFALVRKAHDAVTVPQRFEEARRPASIAPGEVEQAFIAANPALGEDGIAVICAEGRITEVRICLAKDLSFRSCPQVDARGCRLRRAAMPSPSR